MDNKNEKEAYWNQYYSNITIVDKLTPSQFCIFVSEEIQQNKFVVDIGCGTGRDSFFFAHRGHDVLGIDGSQAAIDYCTKRAEKFNAKLHFACMQVTDENIIGAVLDKNIHQLPVVIYARFLLHAIYMQEEIAFLELCSKIPQIYMLAFEFRTVRDQVLQKETQAHYRRFVDPMNTIASIRTNSFDISYYVEGFGFAKYKNDDAYVARCIAIRK